MNDPIHPIVPSLPQTDHAAETSPPGGEVTSSLPDNAPSADDEATRMPSSAPGSSASGTAVLQFFGDYVVVKKIGEGGMGSVFLAEDTKLRHPAVELFLLPLPRLPRYAASVCRPPPRTAAGCR